MKPRFVLALPLLLFSLLGGCAGPGPGTPAGSPFSDAATTPPLLGVTGNSDAAPAFTPAPAPAAAPASTPSPSRAATASSMPLPTVSDSDLLRTGDLLTIRLSGVPADDAGVYDVKIGDQGEISMPLLPGSFRAAGLTSSQLKHEIEAAYRDHKIYSTPNITIVPQLRYVNVNGEVRTPQRIPFTNDLTILKALAACGGFTDYADKHRVKLLRGGQVAVFDAVAAIKNPSLDSPLTAGDQIEVPRSIF